MSYSLFMLTSLKSFQHVKLELFTPPAPQRSCGKVMFFSKVSVFHSVQGVPMWPLPMMHWDMGITSPFSRYQTWDLPKSRSSQAYRLDAFWVKSCGIAPSTLDTRHGTHSLLCYCNCWSSLGICSNCSLEDLPRPHQYWHLVAVARTHTVCKRAVPILL